MPNPRAHRPTQRDPRVNTSVDSRSAEEPARDPRWTVMVFMSAQNVAGEAVSLAGEAQADIAEMATVSSNEHVNIFYQLHANGVPERSHVGKKLEPVPEDKRDNTRGEALIEFIRWALGEAQHELTDYSLLVLWGHAYRFGFSPVVTKTGIDAMDFEELSSVLRQAQKAFQVGYQVDFVPKLDIIGFDACDLSTAEMVVQLQEYSDYLLASQVGIPLPGWPYDRIFARLAKPKDRPMGAAELGSYIVRRFCESYQAPKSLEPTDPTERAVSLTLLDLGRARDLFSLTESLARELAIAMDDDEEELSLTSSLFRRSQTVEDKPFVDIVTLCANLFRYSGSEGVRSAAQALGNLVVSPGPVVPGKSVDGEGKPLVVEHGRNALGTACLNGVSIYAPQVALDTHDPARASHWYEKFLFAKQTLWNELVRALAQPE